jgi:hypothetical protein
MPDRQLRIVRDATELGTLSEADARELLQIGFAEERFLTYCMQHRARLLDLPENEKEGESA